MKYFILLFTLLFHTLVYSQLNTSNRTVNQKLNFKAGANFNSLTASTILTLDGSKDLASSSVTTADLAFIDNLLSLDTNGDGIVQFVDSTDSFTASKVISGTEGIVLPSGTTAQRDGTPTAGEIRYNTDTNTFEGYSNAWGAIGGGGGGGLDIFYNEDHETDVDSSDYTTGLNATFDNGGTLGGALANETTNPIAGSTSIKYTTSATATNSTNDWIASASITLDDKQKGNFVGFNFFYTWDGSDDLLCVIVWDDTNNAVLNDSTDCLETASNPTRYSLGVFIPTSTNAIKLGFHHTGASESSKVLVFDDLELSSNPFVYKNFAEENVYSARIENDGTASILSQNVEWIDSVTRTGTGQTTLDISGLGLTTAPSVQVSRDDSVNDSKLSAWVRTVSTTSITIGTGEDAVGFADRGYNITIGKQGSDYQAPAEHVVTPAKSASTVVYAAGNNGASVSEGNAFNWTEVSDPDGAWDGETYTAQEGSGVLLISGQARLSANTAGQNVALRKNGTIIKYAGGENASQNRYDFVFMLNENEYVKGDTFTITFTTSVTLNNDTTFHHINIMEQKTSQFLAAVPMNYTQTKYLGSDQTGAGVDLITFNNVIPNKIYEVIVHSSWDAADTFQEWHLVDGSNNRLAYINNRTTGTTGRGNMTFVRKIVAPSDGTIKIRTISSMTGTVYGDGTDGNTHATLTELNHTKETTRF